MKTYRHIILSSLFASTAALSAYTGPVSASSYSTDLAPTQIHLPGDACYGGKSNIAELLTLNH